MPCFIKQQGSRYTLVDAAGTRLSGPLSFEEAQARLKQQQIAERMAEQAQRDRDPKEQKRLAEKAAYAWKKQHPKEFRENVAAWEKYFGLDKFDESTGVRWHVGASRSLKGPVQRLTELRYKQAAIFQGGNKELLEQYDRLAARQRDPQAAAKAKRQQSAATSARVAKQWAALAVPEHNRTSLIATKLKLDPRHVRRIVDELGLRTKKRTHRRIRNSL